MVLMHYARTRSGWAIELSGAALACAAAAACGNAPSAQSSSQMPPALVQVAIVKSVPLQEASEYVATLQSLSSTSIKPEVSGEVTRIYVKSGDRVTPGMPLFQIDPLRQEASVSSQDSARVAQEAATNFAKQQLERARTLSAAGAISSQELEQAQANYDAAAAQLASLNARVQQERVTLKYYEVRAPVPGAVGDVPVRVGAHVTSDTVLTTVDQNTNLEVYVPVPLERSGDLKLGMPLEVLDGQGAVLGRTTVSFISPRVDDGTQSVLVKGRLAGDGRLRTSQYVRARLVWRSADGLAIPLLSVIRVNGQPFVFIAENRNGHPVAAQRQVAVGPIVGNDIVVTGGLTAGERVVVSGVQKLADGVPIRTS
jgi:RND family efflux transporter MFP subunit